MTKIRIMTASVRGYAHKIKNMPCQDAWKRKHVDDGCEIIAVADGHGNVKAHPFSEKGAGFAVEIFCRIISNYTQCVEYAVNTRIDLTAFYNHTVIRCALTAVV